MRIAVVAPPFYPLPPPGYGGTERICAFLAEGLHDRGHDVTLIGVGARGVRCGFIATRDEPHSEGTEDDTELEVLHAVRTADVLWDLAPGIVHDHSRAGPLTGLARPAPTVVTVHGSVQPGTIRHDLLAALGARVALVAISDSQRRQAPGLPWRTTIANGVRLSDLVFRAEKDAYVLYLGRVSEDKGVHLAIDAAARAGWPLVIAGAGTIPSEERYLNTVIRPRVGPGIKLVGEVRGRQRLDLLAWARCLVLPARWAEPFGLVLVEAMASGTPVVGLRAGALPELVVDGVTGVLCDQPAELPAAIDAVSALDPHQCRSHVEAHYSVERMVDGYENLFRVLVE